MELRGAGNGPPSTSLKRPQRGLSRLVCISIGLRVAIDSVRAEPQLPQLVDDLGENVEHPCRPTLSEVAHNRDLAPQSAGAASSTLGGAPVRLAILGSRFGGSLIRLRAGPRPAWSSSP